MGEINMILLGALATMGLFSLVALFGSFYTVEQQEEAVVERFGRYVRSAKAGLLQAALCRGCT